MLSKTEVVKYRKGIERLYDSVCTVIASEEVTDARGVTAFTDVIIVENQPCRLSQGTNPKAKNNYVVTEADKDVTLYIAPEVNIPAGSTILVTYNNLTLEFKASGLPAYYDAYQKIRLETVGRWV